MADLSIIIVSYNTRELLESCLRSVFAEMQGLPTEVFVVDNASIDGSREMVHEKFPQVHLIAHEANLGFAAANNSALRRSTAPVVLLLNSDTVIRPGAIQNVWRFMQDHPEAGITGCKLLNPDGTLQPSCRSFPSVWNLFSEASFLYRVFPKTKLFGSYYMTWFNHDDLLEVDVVMGAFMMVRKEVFDAVGLFDESFFLYTEETDFCYRANRHGYRTWFFPGASIVHHGGGSVRDLQEYYFRLHETMIHYIRKHFNGFPRAAALVIKKLGVAVRVAAYFFAGFVTFNAHLIRKAASYFRLLWRLLL